MRTLHNKTLNSYNNRKIDKYSKNETIASWLMISPMVLGFLVFTLYPMLWVYRYAFCDYDGVRTVFCGLDNFIRVFTRDVRYWKSLINTFIIAYGKLLIEFPLALGLAVALNNKFRGSIFYRVTFYLPAVISTAVAGLVFCFLFSSYNGMVNNILSMLKLISAPVNWFGSKWTAMTVLIVSSIWLGYGQNMLFFLAGLQGIPDDLYEAADIDGANSWSKFWRITMPMLMPVFRVVLMMAIVYGMKIMDSVLVITNGAPADETDVAMLYIYRFFFDTNGAAKQWGYASSLGVVTSLIICFATLLYLRVSDKSAKID